jgi:hypothetical protein
MPHAVDFAGLHVAVRFLAAAAYENLNGTTVVFPCPNSNKLSGRAQRDSVRVGCRRRAGGPGSATRPARAGGAAILLASGQVGPARNHATRLPVTIRVIRVRA